MAWLSFLRKAWCRFNLTCWWLYMLILLLFAAIWQAKANRAVPTLLLNFPFLFRFLRVSPKLLAPSAFALLLTFLPEDYLSLFGLWLSNLLSFLTYHACVYQKRHFQRSLSFSLLSSALRIYHLSFARITVFSSIYLSFSARTCLRFKSIVRGCYFCVWCLWFLCWLSRVPSRTHFYCFEEFLSCSWRTQSRLPSHSS